MRAKIWNLSTLALRSGPAATRVLDVARQSITAAKDGPAMNRTRHWSREAA